MSAALAAAHVQLAIERCPDAASYNVDAWTAAVLAHLEPLPADRAWRRLSCRTKLQPVARTIPTVVRTLSPAAGTRPQPTCPAVCLATHRDEDAVA